MDSEDRFSKEDISPAMAIWQRDFNGQPVTDTEMLYSNLVFAAERYSFSHGGVWPTLKELEDWTEENAEKPDMTSNFLSCAQEREQKEQK